MQVWNSPTTNNNNSKAVATKANSKENRYINQLLVNVQKNRL